MILRHGFLLFAVAGLRGREDINGWGRACILLTFIDLQISSLNGQELAPTK